MTSLSGCSTAMARRARRFRSSRWKCSSISISVVPLVREAPMAAKKARMASGVKPRRRRPQRVGMRGSSQPLTRLLLHELQELAFAEHRVGQVEAVEFNLLRREDAELLDIPAVKRLVISEFERAHGVRDAARWNPTGRARSRTWDRCTTRRRCGGATRAGCGT